MKLRRAGILAAAIGLIAAICVAAQAAEVQDEAKPKPALPPVSASAVLRAARASNPALPPLATRLPAARRAPESSTAGGARTYSNGLADGRAH